MLLFSLSTPTSLIAVWLRWWLPSPLPVLKLLFFLVVLSVFPHFSQLSITLLSSGRGTTLRALSHCRTMLYVRIFCTIITLMIWRPVHGTSDGRKGGGRSASEFSAVSSEMDIAFVPSLEEIGYQQRIASFLAVWWCDGATRLSRPFQRSPFHASITKGVGYGLSLDSSIGQANTVSRQDFICPITFWLVGTMLKFPRLCRLIVVACIRCSRLSGTNTNVLTFCLFRRL